MKTAVVPSSWLGIAKGWSAHNLIKMAEIVEAAGVDPNDLPAVKTACEDFDNKTKNQVRGLRKRIKALDEEKKELLAELSPLEPIMRVVHWDRIKKGEI